jgi:hypothetical protein
LRREKQGTGNREGEEGGAVFVFHPNTNQEAEPEPVTRFLAVDRARDAAGASEPDERLECIHREPMMHEQEDRRCESSEGRQTLREDPTAEFPRQLAR